MNGAIRLYHAPSLAELPDSTNTVEFGRTFPVDPVSVEVPAPPARYFQLRLE